MITNDNISWALARDHLRKPVKTLLSRARKTRPDLRRDANGFTQMQRRFVAHYTSGVRGVKYNKTRAAIAAGYSPRTAYSIGSELSKKPHIKAAIERAHRLTLDYLRKPKNS